MSDTTMAISILWVFVFIYSIVGSIDFGAGFWSMVYGKGDDTKAASIANRFLSPSWKVTNVFLVLLVVALVGFFPRAAFYLGTLLLLPVSLVLILLTLRSTFMVYSYSVPRYSKMLNWVSGLTGLIIPGLLISILPISLGGFIEMRQGYPQLMLGKLLQSPTEYAYLGFGITTELFLSALFLSDYAREAEDDKSYRTYRSLAVALGPIALGMAVLAAFLIVPEAGWLETRMAAEWPWFAASAAAFAVGYSSLLWSKHMSGKAAAMEGTAAWTGHPRVAVVAVVAQYGFASLGYGAAHLPYIIYPYLTVKEGFTNSAMFHSLLIGYTIGTIVLLPAFIWFWRLFLKDKRYLKQE